MIDFEGYYSVDEEKVEYVSTRNRPGDTPYGLFLHLTSGAELGVWYQKELARKEARDKIVRKIERERRRDAEDILNRMQLIKWAVDGMDKRQLKIWRQLKALLAVEPDEKN